MWLKSHDIWDINVANAFDLLSTIRNSKLENDTFDFDITFFRTLTTESVPLIDDLQPCFLNIVI